MFLQRSIAQQILALLLREPCLLSFLLHKILCLSFTKRCERDLIEDIDQRTGLCCFGHNIHKPSFAGCYQAESSLSQRTQTTEKMLIEGRTRNKCFKPVDTKYRNLFPIQKTGNNLF